MAVHDILSVVAKLIVSGCGKVIEVPAIVVIWLSLHSELYE